MADKYSDFKEYEKNPFLQDMVSGGGFSKTISYKSETFKSNTVVTQSTGEVMNGSLGFIKRTKVDSEEFVKVYAEGLKDLYKLNPPALKVFVYIMGLAKIEKDKVMFDVDACKEEINYKSKSQIYKGLTNLLENRVIAKTKWNYIYFINPSIFWNGKRLAIVNLYEKENGEEEEGEEMENPLSNQPNIFTNKTAKEELQEMKNPTQIQEENK